MKIKIIIILFCSMAVKLIYSQPIGNMPVAGGGNSGSFWSRQGNNFVGGTNNIFGFQSGANSQIWHMTNGVFRILMENGGTGNNAGRVAMSNNLPAAFQPQARLHLFQTGGDVFTKYTTNATGNTSNDGFDVGLGQFGIGMLIQNEPQTPIDFILMEMACQVMAIPLVLAYRAAHCCKAS